MRHKGPPGYCGGADAGGGSVHPNNVPLPSDRTRYSAFAFDYGTLAAAETYREGEPDGLAPRGSSVIGEH